MIDHTVVIYAVGIFVSLYGVVLFLAYWATIGRASFVYGCVTLLLFGLLVQYSMALMSRLELLNDGTKEILHSFWWPFRNYLVILAIMLLCGGLTARWIKSARRKNNFIITPDYRGPDRRKRML